MSIRRCRPLQQWKVLNMTRLALTVLAERRKSRLWDCVKEQHNVERFSGAGSPWLW